MSTITIQIKRDTAANWVTNGARVLASGELGLETDANKFKIGNGSSTYAALGYAQGVATLAAATDYVSAPIATANTSIATGLAGKFPLNAPLGVSGASPTLTGAANGARLNEWTGTGNPTLGSGSDGDAISIVNLTATTFTMGGSTAGAGYKNTVAPNETGVFLYTTASGWVSNTPGNITTTVGTSRSLVAADNGNTLECTATVSLTVPAGLDRGFSVAVIPFGTTSIVSSGGALLDGVTATQTRTKTSNKMFAIVGLASAADSYTVTGF